MTTNKDIPDTRCWVQAFGVGTLPVQYHFLYMAKKECCLWQVFVMTPNKAISTQPEYYIHA